MRKQDKAIVWPAYFDSARTRKEGRRVPKSIAVPSPKFQEIMEVTEKLGLNCQGAAETGYPKTPWVKTGMIMVEKQGSKEQTVRKIAKQLLKIRNEPLRPQ